ncbi:MAG: hypothetical protein P8J79_08765 [Halioglobus sp.]|nr:hypothetical protein [Halioglobus sp.]
MTSNRQQFVRLISKRASQLDFFVDQGMNPLTPTKPVTNGLWEAARRINRIAENQPLAVISQLISVLAPS